MGGFIGEDVDGPRVVVNNQNTDDNNHNSNNNDSNNDNNSNNNLNNNLNNDDENDSNNNNESSTQRDDPVKPEGGGEGKGCVYCLNAHNGSIHWCTSLPGEVKSAPLFVHARRGDGTDTGNGTDTDNGAHTERAPAVFIAVGSYDGCLYLLSPTDGRVMARVDCGGSLYTSPGTALSTHPNTSYQHNLSVYTIDTPCQFHYHALLSKRHLATPSFLALSHRSHSSHHSPTLSSPCSVIGAR